MGLKLRVFRFLSTTHAKTNAMQMHPRSLRREMFYVCLSSRSERGRCRRHTHLENRGYFDCGKTQRPQLEPHAGLKMAQVLGSSCISVKLAKLRTILIFVKEGMNRSTLLSKMHENKNEKICKISSNLNCC